MSATAPFASGFTFRLAGRSIWVVAAPMKDLLPDIRYALRAHPEVADVTLVTLLTLMLGIGANVVVLEW